MSLEHSPVQSKLRVLRRKAAAEKLGCHVATLMRWSREARYAHLEFPAPISLADGSVGFFESEIDEWLQNRPRIERAEAAK